MSVVQMSEKEAKTSFLRVRHLELAVAVRMFTAMGCFEGVSDSVARATMQRLADAAETSGFKEPIRSCKGAEVYLCCPPGTSEGWSFLWKFPMIPLTSGSGLEHLATPTQSDLVLGVLEVPLNPLKGEEVVDLLSEEFAERHRDIVAPFYGRPGSRFFRFNSPKRGVEVIGLIH